MRIDDYDLKNVPQDLIEWLTEVTELLNNGKYAMRYYGATAPTSTTPGEQGEMILYNDSGTWTVGIYTDSTDTWKKVALSAL